MKENENENEKEKEKEKLNEILSVTAHPLK